MVLRSCLMEISPSGPLTVALSCVPSRVSTTGPATTPETCRVAGLDAWKLKCVRPRQGQGGLHGAPPERKGRVYEQAAAFSFDGRAEVIRLHVSARRACSRQEHSRPASLWIALAAQASAVKLPGRAWASAPVPRRSPLHGTNHRTTARSSPAWGLRRSPRGGGRG